MSIELMAPGQAGVDAVKSTRRSIAAIAGAAALLLADPIPGIQVTAVAKQGRRLKGYRVLVILYRDQRNGGLIACPLTVG